MPGTRSQRAAALASESAAVAASESGAAAKVRDLFNSVHSDPFRHVLLCVHKMLTFRSFLRGGRDSCRDLVTSRVRGFQR